MRNRKSGNQEIRESGNLIADFLITHYFIVFIIATYLIVGVLYAVKTPHWQAPDEPAHYNYVKYLAENHRFPVLQMGDYPHRYLREIVDKKFPPEMSIEPLRYEFHQPPLYYVLAAVVYKLFAGSLLPLRLLSVLLGCCLLWVAYHIAKEIFPRDEALGLGATAFVAFVPMHIAMTAAVNNDTLAELILAVILWVLVRYVQTSPPRLGGIGGGRLVGLGMLMGLGLLTKIATLVAIPVALAAIVVKGTRLEQSRKPDFTRRYLLSAICFLLPALLLAMPWFVRNALVYGGLDIWGLGRHDAVVVSQPRTAEWLAQLGAAGLAKEFILTTFKSFWAQFGWMGIPVDQRIYLTLALLCAVVGLGLVLFVVKNLRHRKLTSSQSMVLGLLALSALFTLLSYLWYNLTFVQHQGRYLFPALVPIGLAFALGLREVLARKNAKIAAFLLLAGVLILAAKGFVTGDFNRLIILLLGGAAIALGIKALLPEKYDDLAFALPYLGLLGLDLICLFWFIVPYFQS